MLGLASPQAGSFVGTWMPLLLIVGLAWLLLIRPAQQQRKELDAMRAGLKPGDEVLTSGGLYGIVTKLREERVHLRVAEGVQVEVARTAVAQVVPREKE